MTVHSNLGGWRKLKSYVGHVEFDVVRYPITTPKKQSSIYLGVRRKGKLEI